MRQRGLTLVELLAATAIAALVLSAVMGVLANLSRVEAVGARVSREASLEERLQELLARDVELADGCRATSTGLSLRGRSALDPGTLEVRHLASVVSYEVRRLAGKDWLVRVQDAAGRPRLTELVCPGVRSVSLNASAAGPGKWQPVPGRLVVAAAFEGREPVQYIFRRPVSP